MLRRSLTVLAAVFALFATVTAASARVEVQVDLASQRMQVTTTNGESYNWVISSGSDGYRTIRGSFRPYRLEKKWYSRKYGGNMPNAIFFRGGFAIHGTGAVGMLGRPVSHGCVRLHPANAAKLFALVQKRGEGQAPEHQLGDSAWPRAATGTGLSRPRCSLRLPPGRPISRGLVLAALICRKAGHLA
jgi:hypothetical protein